VQVLNTAVQLDESLTAYLIGNFCCASVHHFTQYSIITCRVPANKPRQTWFVCSMCETTRHWSSELYYASVCTKFSVSLFM